MEYTPISEEEFGRLEREAAQSRLTEPAVQSVFCKSHGNIEMTLRNGSTVTFFAAKLKGLENASMCDLADVTMAEEGTVLEFPSLDQHYQLAALLEVVLGLPTAKSMGLKGGRSKSKAKAEAARANGTKGGRPRKTAPPGALIPKSQAMLP